MYVYFTLISANNKTHANSNTSLNSLSQVKASDKLRQEKIESLPKEEELGIGK